MLDKLIKIYQARCWLGYKITRDNILNYHHLIKKEYGGLKTLENGAIVSQLAHQYLHVIEYKKKDIYIELNEILKSINTQLHTPTIEQYKKISRLIKLFEDEFKNAKNSRGKMLIDKYRKIPK